VTKALRKRRICHPSVAWRHRHGTAKLSLTPSVGITCVEGSAAIYEIFLQFLNPTYTHIIFGL